MMLWGISVGCLLFPLKACNDILLASNVETGVIPLPSAHKPRHASIPHNTPNQGHFNQAPLESYVQLPLRSTFRVVE